MDMSSDEKMTTDHCVKRQSSKLTCMDVGFKAEEETDKHHLTKPHQREPHTSARTSRIETTGEWRRRTRVADSSPGDTRKTRGIMLGVEA